MAYELINADCLAAMDIMPDDSVDAIITDPPYGLKFMGEKWDYEPYTTGRNRIEGYEAELISG